MHLAVLDEDLTVHDVRCGYIQVRTELSYPSVVSLINADPFWQHSNGHRFNVHPQDIFVTDLPPTTINFVFEYQAACEQNACTNGGTFLGT